MSNIYPTDAMTNSDSMAGLSSDLHSSQLFSESELAQVDRLARGNNSMMLGSNNLDTDFNRVEGGAGDILSGTDSADLFVFTSPGATV